jgi:hypothetical protein
LQETLPQQKPPELEQNVVPLVFVQQVWPALQDEFPQHNWPALIQYFDPLLPVQQVWPALQEELPQHSLPAAMQNGLPVLVSAGQQDCPGVQAGEQVAALARLIPIALKTMPSSNAPSNLTACRRGIGLARIRAASSTR